MTDRKARLSERAMSSLPKPRKMAVTLNAVKVREVLVLHRWKEQDAERSRAVNPDGTIVITWWNRGPAALMLVEQDGQAYLYKPFTSAGLASRAIKGD